MGTAAKSRNFAFILYPESLPADWQTRLTMIGRPMAISPLHDKDKSEMKSADAMRREAERRAQRQCGKIENPMDRAVEISKAKEYWLGVVRREQNNLPEFKKPHYHVLYVAANPVTADSVRRKIQRALSKESIAHVEVVDNVQNYYLYLSHDSIDAREKGKHRYDVKDIIKLNEFDIERYIVLDKEQKKVLGDAIMEMVVKYKLKNMGEVVRMLPKHGASIGVKTISELEDVLNGRGWFIKMLMDANYQDRNRVSGQVAEGPGTGWEDLYPEMESQDRTSTQNPGKVWNPDAEE